MKEENKELKEVIENKKQEETKKEDKTKEKSSDQSTKMNKIKSESKLLVENKEVVVPGQTLAKGFDFLPSNGSYRIDEEIKAKILGLINMEGKVLKIIPLSGKYLPKKYDVIIAKVTDITMNAWRFDINSGYNAMLNVREVGHSNHSYNSYPQKGSLSKLYDVGDYVFCKITNVSGQNLVDLSTNGPGLRKLYGGRILKVNTHKVPRLIGKKGSMVNMIKQATESKMIVGQNGIVWLLAEPQMEAIAIKAIRKIERESHISGLTDRIKQFLEKETGKKIEMNKDRRNNSENNNNRN